MANFSYKQSKTTTLKACGMLDIKNNVIYIDDEPKNISTLLSDFDGVSVELQVKIKTDVELDEPSETDKEVEEE